MKNKKLFSIIALILAFCMILAVGWSGSGSSDSGSDDAAATDEGAPADDAGATDDGGAAEGEVQHKMAFIVPYELDSLPWLIQFCRDIPAYDEAHPEVEMDITEALEADQYEPLIRSYCDDGYDMIFAFYNNFTDTVLLLQDEYPDVQWFAFDGYYSDELLGQIKNIIDFHENLDGAYLSGMASALMTKTNKIAMVYGMDIDFNVQLAGAFEDGVFAVNPDIEISNVIANTYVDPQVGEELGTDLASKGFDVIFSNAGTTETGLVKACIEHNIYYAADSTSYIPAYNEDAGIDGSSVQLCSRRFDVGKAHLVMMQKALDGEFEGKGGSVYYMPFDNDTTWFEINEDLLPEDVVAQLKDAQAKIESGEITVSLEPSVW